MNEAEPNAGAGAGAMWALGDYPKVAADVLTDLGRQLVSAAGIEPGQRVLDVAAGSGNAAVQAALVGADVVASDLTPELFVAGRAVAAARDVSLKWVEADAEHLPFADGEFDVVMSCIGVMFAPDHHAAANELVRVCRPGGTIALLNWTPDGSIGDFFRVFAPYAPSPPPGFVSPVMWGNEAYVRELFGDRVSGLDVSPDTLPVDHFGSPEEFVEYYKAHFGPTIATYASVAGTERAAELDRDFLTYAIQTNRGEPDGPAIYGFDYAVIRATRSGQ
ncbi:class I SAM-dependent methyltransferase [Flindersiella endophytica]